jgi:hypothetical protein
MSTNLQVSASYDESLDLWETYDADENMLDNRDNRQSTIADAFLTMEVEVELDDHVSVAAHESNGDTWGIMDDGGHANHRAIGKLPSFYDHEDDFEEDFEDEDDSEDDYDEDEAPRTPSPAERQIIVLQSDNNVHEITPEQQAPSKVNLPDMTELQFKCHLTLKKLANSMRRSDETRSIVMRQRLQSPVFQGSISDSDFFSSKHASAIEESRRKIYQLVNMGVSSTMDSRF